MVPGVVTAALLQSEREAGAGERTEREKSRENSSEPTMHLPLDLLCEINFPVV